MGEKLTNQEYWDSTYIARQEVAPVAIGGFKNHCAKEIYSKVITLVEQADSILELGGGGSAWLAFFSQRYPEKRFTAIDYSEEGSKKLRNFLQQQQILNVEVIVADFVSYKTYEKFDLVYSHGVVEHFENLSNILRAHSRFLDESGRMFTVIPNMTGILGVLTRMMNKEVYDIHVPHDLDSFENGHYDAGLRLIESGYLCSNNFGVLSSCVSGAGWPKLQLYRFLSRVSKATWWLEEKFFNLPSTKLFSPYIYAISELK